MNYSVLYTIELLDGYIVLYGGKYLSKWKTLNIVPFSTIRIV